MKTYNGVDLANEFDCDTLGGAGILINPAPAAAPPVAETAAPVEQSERPKAPKEKKQKSLQKGPKR